MDKEVGNFRAETLKWSKIADCYSDLRLQSPPSSLWPRLAKPLAHRRACAHAREIFNLYLISSHIASLHAHHLPDGMNIYACTARFLP